MSGAEDEGRAPRDVLDTSAAGGMIIRGGVMRLGSYVVVVLLSLLPAALLARHLGAARFSAYTTVLSLAALVSLATDAGMSNYGIREYAAREGAEREALMRDLLGLRVALTLLGVLGAVLFALCAGYSLALLAGTFVASLAMVALVVQHTYSIPLAAELRLGVLSLIEVLRQVLTVIALVALVAVNAGVFPLLAVTLVVYMVLTPLTAMLVRGRVSLRMEVRFASWVALLRPTIAFSLATAVGAIYIYTAQILTSLAATPHQSGLFALSFRVYFIAVTIPGMVVGGAIPLLARAARDDRERLAYALQRIFEVSLILGVATSLGFFAGAAFIVKVIAGPTFPQYAGAVPVLRIQGIAMIASFLIAVWGFGLLSLKRYTGLLIVNALALLVSCTLTLVLAATLGAKGAAIATLCGEATLGSGCLFVLVRWNPELRPRLAVLPKVILAAAPAVALVVVLDLPSLVVAVIALCVYGLLILLTRAVPSEIAELIPRPGRGAVLP
ncbi:MAG TPA: polysaccharide biosynthesis C-terminal domain-containing protein [Solirubrobacteraceae bacterium]|nr:polysaccharide biosynthesis C-terminal domain-containing protein [Solirubrobacteraceae bacterium]